MDSAEQLQKIYLAGFDIQTFDRYPRAVGVVRGDCIALLEPTPNGLHMIGTPGWRLGEIMGVLVEREGRPIFQAKNDILDATPDRISALQQFRSDLEQLLLPTA